MINSGKGFDQKCAKTKKEKRKLTIFLSQIIKIKSGEVYKQNQSKRSIEIYTKNYYLIMEHRHMILQEPFSNVWLSHQCVMKEAFGTPRVGALGVLPTHTLDFELKLVAALD